MTDIAIRVENLSKLYRIGARQESYKTLRDTLVNAATGPFRRLGNLPSSIFHPSSSNNPPSSILHSLSDFVWALKDVSFSVKRGEVIGIIGRNGAGKTTLLKILSRITDPTEGHAEIHGRVGSLLEVGTGFHPELTGRENIYLNGAILGMKKAEIKRKFDEIVDFAGFEKFIDTPVKHFSSGMQVRLAFSVAAHLEPEILLVDEVLAVGDVEFQKKCLGKMKSVTGEGKTVLFVSHNMTAIRNLCKRTILIDNGKLVLDVDTEYAVSKYLDKNLLEGACVSDKQIENKVEGFIKRYNPTIRFKEISITNQNGLLSNTFRSNEPIVVNITYECLIGVNDMHVVIQIVDEENTPILTSQDSDDSGKGFMYKREAGIYRSSCIIPPNFFGEKEFYLTVHLEYPKIEHLILNKILSFEVKFAGYNNLPLYHWSSFLRPRFNWETRVVDHKRES